MSRYLVGPDGRFGSAAVGAESTVGDAAADLEEAAEARPHAAATGDAVARARRVRQDLARHEDAGGRPRLGDARVVANTFDVGARLASDLDAGACVDGGARLARLWLGVGAGLCARRLGDGDRAATDTKKKHPHDEDPKFSHGARTPRRAALFKAAGVLVGVFVVVLLCALGGCAPADGGGLNDTTIVVLIGGGLACLFAAFLSWLIERWQEWRERRDIRRGVPRARGPQ